VNIAVAAIAGPEFELSVVIEIASAAVADAGVRRDRRRPGGSSSARGSPPSSSSAAIAIAAGF
jgi:hypothetical protein